LASDILPEKEPALLNLKEIRKACLRAKDIVKQLLSFARKTDPKRHPIKLIAVVDDEASNIYVGRNRLERLGYQVETRMSPLEALELFQADPHQFDLLITDMSMPQMTGDRLVKEILKLRPDMPTILCSGFNEKMDEERAAEIGIRQYIEKNYDKRFMAKIVRDVLDGK
jgi:CheY-like chemotaxis protein